MDQLSGEATVPSVVNSNETPQTKRMRKGDVGPDGRIFHYYRKNGSPAWFKDVAAMQKFNIKKNEATVRPLCGSTRTIRGLSRVLLNSAKKRAKKFGGMVTITREWVIERLQNGVSEISGTAFVIPMMASDSKGCQARSPSLDRIDSNNPNYSPDNTRILLYQENCALNMFGDIPSLPILEPLVAGLKRKAALMQQEPAPDAASSNPSA